MPHPRKIFIGVAWPYANGDQHIGHLAGAYLPPDIFARYQRLVGNEVLMVSGSDTHGTPITVRAEAEGVSPAALVERFHTGFIETYLQLGLTFDLFTHTDTQNHWDITHRMFRRHLEQRYLYTAVQQQLYDPVARRFLPDRYVEGTCPFCGYDAARGDQCDQCSQTYEAIELKQPRSRLTGSHTLDVRQTEHFFLDLARLNAPLLAWLEQGKAHWRPHVLHFTRTQLAQGTLRGRPITRDLEWGISIPLGGYAHKCLYVWYEAVIGYLSATIEWAQLQQTPGTWRTWWETATPADVRTYYFIGKDNIPFHTIFWPAMLLAYGGLQLPYDVPANAYLNMAGHKFSKSRGHVISIRSVLERYQADAWRYALTAMAPETNDVDFTWEDFVERVNSELVATWGNLVQRTLGFAASRWGGVVPTPGTLDTQDQALLAEIQGGFTTVGALYDAVKLKAALQEVRRLSQRVNQYLQAKAPWTTLTRDRQTAATTIYVALQAIDWLKLLWAPILPHSSQQLHTLLGYNGQLFGRQYTDTVNDARGVHLVLRYDHRDAMGQWDARPLAPGQPLRPPQPLFVRVTADTEEDPTPPEHVHHRTT